MSLSTSAGSCRQVSHRWLLTVLEPTIAQAFDLHGAVRRGVRCAHTPGKNPRLQAIQLHPYGLLDYALRAGAASVPRVAVTLAVAAMPSTERKRVGDQELRFLRQGPEQTPGSGRHQPRLQRGAAVRVRSLT